MLTEVQFALLVDVFVVLACLGLVVLFSRWAHSHPAVLYLTFHFYVVTMRLVCVSLETETLFTRFIKVCCYLALTDHEIVSATGVADIGRLVMEDWWMT